jgi:hypothetical protein
MNFRTSGEILSPELVLVSGAQLALALKLTLT